VTGLLVLDGLLRGRPDVIISAISHLILPTLAIGFSLFPQLLRVIKETGRRAMNNPAARAARRAGVRGLRYWVLYIFSLTAVPVLSLIAGTFGYLIGGVVVVEVIFSWNGLGTFVVNAVGTGDYNSIQGVVLIASAVYAIAYFLSDIFSWIIDPRILEATHA
jgi:peptide/nickel transport system permease protein